MVKLEQMDWETAKENAVRLNRSAQMDLILSEIILERVNKECKNFIEKDTGTKEK